MGIVNAAVRAVSGLIAALALAVMGSADLYCADFARAGKVIVCFRCDDFFAVKGLPSEKVFRTKKRIIELFRKHHVPLTIGVIPYVHKSISGQLSSFTELTPGDPVASLLRSVAADRNFEVALHGLTHYPNRISKVSEWAGLPAELQAAKIDRGRRILSGALGLYRPDTFIPPWNSFDLNTVKALKANGFTYLSGDAGIVKNSPFTRRNPYEREYLKVNIVPGACALSELAEVLRLSGRGPAGQVVVVVFHPYDFREYRGAAAKGSAFFDLAGLDRLLGNLGKDGNLEFLRIRDLDPGAIPASRYSAACRYCVMLKAAEAVFPRKALEVLGLTDKGAGHWLAKGRYLPEAEYSKLFSRLLILLSLLSAASGIASGAAAAFLMGRQFRAKRLVPVLLVFLSIFAGGLLCLEFRTESLSAPNALGLQVLYYIFFASALPSFLVVLKKRSGRGPSYYPDI